MIMGLIGCQSTPKTEYIHSKNTDTIIEIGSRNDFDSSVVLSTRLQIPDHYISKTISKGEKLEIIVDADIKVPDEEMPLIRVAPHTFTEQDARLYAAALLGTDPYYIEYNYEKMNKSYYQREIERLIYAADHWEVFGNYEYDMIYNSEKEIREAIINLSAKIASAPDEAPKNSPAYADIVKNHFLDLYAMAESGVVSRLVFFNDSNSLIQMIYYRDIHSIIGSYLETNCTDVSRVLTVSREEAQLVAEQIIQKMGFSNLICVDCHGVQFNTTTTNDNSSAAYEAVFVPVINGNFVTYTNSEYTSLNGYAKPWQYERLSVYIDDEGIACIRYNGPYQIVEVLTNSTKLLPFSSIQGEFEKMAPLINNEIDYSNEEGRLHRRIITSIELGLVCIREEESDTGLLVPAWDFLGYRENIHPKSGIKMYDTNGRTSFITINAIDGSIIDRSNGF